MRIIKALSRVVTRYSIYPKHYNFYRFSSTTPDEFYLKKLQINFSQVHKLQDDKENVESLIHDLEDNVLNLEEYNDIFHDHDAPASVKNILFKEPTDELMSLLNNCASVQEVFDLLKERDGDLKPEHITQSVLVLWDLQKMFYHVSLMSNTLTNQRNTIKDLEETYYSKLQQHADFKRLLAQIAEKLPTFNVEMLTVILYYLNRIGIGIKGPTCQILLSEIKVRNPTDMPLESMARYIGTVFYKTDLSSYYNIQQYIPAIYSTFENCNSSDGLNLSTICMKHLNRIIPDTVFRKYTEVVSREIQSGELLNAVPRTILNIVMFLNYPQWRDSNVRLINDCMHLMKGHVHMLNTYEVLLFFEIFYKTLEPADMLNEFQRQACKSLSHYEDETVPFLDVRLKLILAVILHSSPMRRNQNTQIIKRHANYDINRNSIMDLYKLLIYTRNPDVRVTKLYWHRVLKLLNTDPTFRENGIWKVCVNYLHYMQNVDNYRIYPLERYINAFIENEIANSIAVHIPLKFACMAYFTIAFGRNAITLEYFINKIEKNANRLSQMQSLNYTKAINYARDYQSPLMTTDNVNRLKEALNSAFQLHIEHTEEDVMKNYCLIKSFIYSENMYGDDQMDQMRKLLSSEHVMGTLSSKILKNLSFCITATNSLLPEVIDKLVHYVCDFKDNVFAFNAERILHACYHLGYCPKQWQDFLSTLSDMILRDQERMSGFSYLQACLALCYFQMLPNAFIKQIFNTTFLDKLDLELANCYYKDVYPIRVKNLMMQLNRAVCIDYPESNVPWFHQKYIDKLKSDKVRVDSFFHTIVKSYLIQIFKDEDYISENVFSPYGYYINFLMHYDHASQPIRTSQLNITHPSQKVAILLVRPKDLTSGHVQFKGKFMLKVRHLEILGYKVATIKHDFWRDLMYGFDKVKYLEELVKPQLSSSRNNLINI